MSATPGPWIVSADGEVFSEPSYASVAMVLLSEDGPANAKLIAAAPDMASAIQTLFTCDLSDLPGDVVAMLRSALSKATGA
jgi:hypothetical protein